MDWLLPFAGLCDGIWGLVVGLFLVFDEFVSSVYVVVLAFNHQFAVDLIRITILK